LFQFDGIFILHEHDYMPALYVCTYYYNVNLLQLTVIY